MDVIGFGALNIDVIATASGLSELAAEQITESTARFEWNREGPTDRDEILEAVHNIGSSSLNFSLGGSAWLTIYALAQMRLGLRLGYVGALGRIEAPGVSFRAQMSELGIDDTWVGRFGREHCGLCLSFIDDNERVMRTYPGANLLMAQHIQDNFEAVVQYLSSARFVHVTSFLDDRTPARMLTVLRAARRRNPALRFSVDPGFDWAEHPSTEVQGILELADVLFVNYREFKALGSYHLGDTDETLARRILRICHRPGVAVFVTKRYDYTEVFVREGDELRTLRFQLQRPVRETEIEDATGAGDVFAASVLAAVTSDRLKVELGGYLGLALARRKLQTPPGAPLDLGQGFLQQKDSPLGGGVRRRVLIVHDENPQWQEVRKFIETRCGIPTEHLGPSDFAADRLAETVDGPVSRCGFAVCLLSAKNSARGSRQPDQMIVHQVGILQGRYGFGRVALLVEYGCDLFTNLSGLIRLGFPAGRVEAKFVELQRMLLRELLTVGSASVRV
ncbi:PfkB family carbohydrate kinase [Nocardia sp. NPDC003482]